MADAENVKYCSMHGVALDEAMVCHVCQKVFEDRYAGQDERPKRQWGQKTNYLVEELARRNRTPWTEKEWLKGWLDRYPASFTNISVCDRCKFFMHHPLMWCPLCGQQCKQEKLTFKELAEKYSDYREGC